MKLEQNIGTVRILASLVDSRIKVSLQGVKVDHGDMRWADAKQRFSAAGYTCSWIGPSPDCFLWKNGVDHKILAADVNLGEMCGLAQEEQSIISSVCEGIADMVAELRNADLTAKWAKDEQGIYYLMVNGLRCEVARDDANDEWDWRVLGGGYGIVEVLGSMPSFDEAKSEAIREALYHSSKL